jgi:hypothetical protein
MSEIKVYINEKQKEFLMLLHALCCIIAGRGIGKSHMIGFSIAIKVNNLPRSLGILTCKELTQLKAKSIPVIQQAWTSLGWIEGEDYVIFKKRPDDWPVPYREPKSKNVIYFRNGTALEIVSARQYDAARGGSYDWVEGDEIAFFPEEFMDSIITPSIRGNQGKFLTTARNFCLLNGYPYSQLKKYHDVKLDDIIKNPFHHQVKLYSSPPQEKEGFWVYKYQDLALNHPDKFNFTTGTAYDNIHAFGKDQIELAKLTMKSRTFDREFGGVKHEKSELNFYWAFDEKIHTFLPSKTYTTVDNALFISEGYATSINTNTVISISLDFSGWFCGLIMFQSTKDYEIMHDAIYGLQDDDIEALIDAFCVKYESHNNKFVLIYGEPRGHDKSHFLSKSRTLYDVVSDRFKHHRWKSIVKCPKAKKTENHDVRYDNMNKLLKESSPYLPKLRINKQTCADPITAINYCEVKPDYTKDKSNEKDRDFPQQHAPHFTDMLDYYIFQKYKSKFDTVIIDTQIDYVL